jgi:hypothetical protein
MKRRKRLLLATVAATGAIAIALGCWFIFLPCPFGMYLDARKAATYSPQWPLSKSEYYAARRAIRGELRFFEVIQQVTVSSSTKVEFWTLAHWEGNLAAGGHHFVLEKRDGRWEIVENASWVS